MRESRAKHFLLRLLVSLYVLAAVPCLAGQTLAPLATPNLDIRTNGAVNAFAMQPDGGMVVGGEFSHIGGLPRSNIARLMPDGSVDLNWNPTVNDAVHALATDAAGAVYVGGVFTKVDEVSRNYIAKISAAGVVDEAWDPNADFHVFSLALHEQETLFIGGSFSLIGGLPRSRIAKISSTGNGAADPNWNPGADNAVLSMLVDSAQLYVGGAFASIGGMPRTALAKLQTSGAGAIDPVWNPGLSGGTVRALASDANGSIFLGGSFGSVGGLVRGNLAKVQATGSGSVDPNWNPSTNSGVNALVLDQDTRVYVGGSFTQISGATFRRVARLAASGTGSPDMTWNPSVNDGAGVFAIQAAGFAPGVLLGGVFSDIAGAESFSLAVVDTEGTLLPHDRSAERAGLVSGVARQPNGGSIIYGNFHSIDGHARSGLARLQASDNLDLQWAPVIDSSVVGAAAVSPAGDVYIGGDFLEVNGVQRQKIAKLSGEGIAEVDMGWNPGITAGGGVFVLAFIDNAVFAGGAFTTIGGVPRNGLAKLAPTGAGTVAAAWNPAPGPAFGAFVSELLSDGLGSVYVAGSFNQIGGFSRQGLAKLSSQDTGAVDPLWDPAPVGGRVLAMSRDMQERLLVGGLFTQIGGQPRQRLARLESTGAGLADPEWNPTANGQVLAIEASANGDIYVGGIFTSVGGQARQSVAKVAAHGVGAVDPAWDPTMNPRARVEGIQFLDAERLIINGQFAEVGGALRQSLVGLPASAPGDDASLTSLTASVGALDPVFDPEHLDYVIVVHSTIEEVAFTANTADPAAELQLNGQPLVSGQSSMNQPLQPGLNFFEINVVSANGMVTREYRVEVVRMSASPAALSIRVDPVPGPVTRGVELRSYRISVTNIGQAALPGISLQVTEPVGMSNVVWICHSPNTCSPSAGEGQVHTEFALDSSLTAWVDLSGELDPSVPFVDLAALVQAPSEGISVSSTVSDPVNGIGIYRDGFE